MSPETMRCALSVEAEARKLKRHLDEYVLLKRDNSSREETISVGDPVKFRESEYCRVQVPIPESARRYVFNLWRKEVALKYNALVRELNQIGVDTDLALIGFKASDGSTQP